MWKGVDMINMGIIEAQEALDEYIKSLGLPAEKRRGLEERVAETKIYDPLTKVLYNYRGFSARLEEEASRASRHETPLSVMMLDVDNFKKYNDTYGHPQGNELLQRLGRVLSQVRKEDTAAKYGGEEFVFIFPDTDAEQAANIAEIIRKNMAAMVVPYVGREDAKNKRYVPNRGYGQVTASIGITSFPSITKAAEPQLLVKDADIALYTAKEAGRDRIVVQKPQTY